MNNRIFENTALMNYLRGNMKGKKYTTTTIQDFLELLDGNGIVITDEDLIASTLLKNNMWINSEIKIEVGR